VLIGQSEKRRFFLVKRTNPPAIPVLSNKLLLSIVDIHYITAGSSSPFVSPIKITNVRCWNSDCTHGCEVKKAAGAISAEKDLFF
jgi:hypothetical protein